MTNSQMDFVPQLQSCQHCGSKHMAECSLLSCCVKWGLQLMVTALLDDWGEV